MKLYIDIGNHLLNLVIISGSVTELWYFACLQHHLSTAFLSDVGHFLFCVDRSAITGNCDHDGLHIIKGHNLSSIPLVTLCGSEALHPLTVAGPVSLNFYSNAYATDLGFKISYRITCE